MEKVKYNGSYNSVIKNFAGTIFTAYYTKGESIKLSDGVLVVKIYKPTQSKTTGGYFKNAIVEFSAGDKRALTFEELHKLNQAIEEAVELLNKERTNLIEKYSKTGYSIVKKHKPFIKKKAVAISNDEIEVGGIYLDNKSREWVYLGVGKIDYISGPLNQDTNEPFSIGYFDAPFMYMPYTKETRLVGENILVSDLSPNKYAQPKRFYGINGKLELDENLPITINCQDSVYKVTNKEREMHYTM